MITSKSAPGYVETTEGKTKLLSWKAILNPHIENVSEPFDVSGASHLELSLVGDCPTVVYFQSKIDSTWKTYEEIKTSGLKFCTIKSFGTVNRIVIIPLRGSGGGSDDVEFNVSINGSSMSNEHSRKDIKVYPSRGKMKFRYSTSRSDLYADWYANTTPLNLSHTHTPLWLGENGVIISAYGERIYRSDNYGKSFKRILDLYLSEDPELVFTTNNPDVNKSVFVAKQNGQVYRSTDLTSDSSSKWELVLNGVSAGRLSWRYGRSICNNVIILSSYGVVDPENPPRFIYLSKDYGATFDEIEVVPIAEMADPTRFHIHDVKYDACGSRIWVTAGDDRSGNIYYSDDWGVSWKKVYPKGGMLQPTVIVPLPDRVLFGTDDRPNGFRVWYRNMDAQEAEVTPEDIHFLYTSTKYAGADLRGVANQNQMDMTQFASQYPYNVLLPFASEGNTFARFLATGDGENFFEIFRPDVIKGVSNVTLGRVCGPDPTDPNKSVYFSFFNPANSTNYYVRAEYPTFVSKDLPLASHKGIDSRGSTNVNMVGSPCKVIEVPMPVTIAAGQTVAVATLDKLLDENWKRIAFTFRWSAAIQHNVYIQYLNKADIVVGQALSLSSNGSFPTTLKEAPILTNKVSIQAKNEDATDRQLTSLIITLWAT